MRRKPILALAAASAVLVPAAVITSSASAAVSQSTSKYFLKGGTSPVKGVKVSGYDGKTVYFAVTTNLGSAGNVSVSSTSGLSLAFGYTGFSGSSIAFTGSQTAVNAALATLAVRAPVSATSVQVQVTAFDNGNGLAFNPENQHFYKYVDYASTGVASSSKTADNAKAAAEASTELGLKGYLASVTSATENDFISSKLQNPTTGAIAKNVWLGGRDQETENTWKWVGGPDNGVVFWEGLSAARGGVAKGYANWNPDGEPNDYNNGNPGEDCMVTNWTASYVPAQYRIGYWNDLPCSTAQSGTEGYVVEYGNKPAGGDFSGVDFVTTSMTVAVPAAKPTFLDALFNLVKFNKKTLKKGVKITVKKPKTKTAPAQTVTCPATFAKMRFSYTLLFTEAGRYSFYFTDSKGKRIPMECGTKIKDRVITQAISAPVIQSVKNGEKPVVVAYLRAATVWANPGPDYPLLNVILKRKDGTLVRQDQPNPPLAGTPLR